MLDKLKEITNGDERRMQLYLKTFVSAVPATIETINSELKNGNFNELRNAVHGMKPLLKVMGFDELWGFANDIEVSIDTKSEIAVIHIKCGEFLGHLKGALKLVDTHRLISDT